MTISEILSDKTHGSTSLYQDALQIFYSYSDERIIGETKINCALLKDHFTVMGLFQNLHSRVKNIDNPKKMRMILNKLIKIILTQKKLIRANSRSNIPDNSSILTISHSSLVYEALLGAIQPQKINHVFCLKSGPMNEGIILCDELRRKTISASVIPDSNLKTAIRNINLVMVGCDLLTENFFINKSGTAEIARIAVESGIPLWIVTEKSRFISNFIKSSTMDHFFEIITLENAFYILSETGLTINLEYINSIT